MNVSPSVYTNVGINFDMETVLLNSNRLQTVIMHSIKRSMYYFVSYQLKDAKFYMNCKQILFVIIPCLVISSLVL